jgi:hypothetical protein
MVARYRFFVSLVIAIPFFRVDPRFASVPADVGEERCGYGKLLAWVAAKALAVVV